MSTYAERPGTFPQSFYDEIFEVVGDLHMDLQDTFTDMDERVGMLVKDLVIRMLTKSKGDVHTMVTDGASMMLWWFMMGREHALRGYPAPVGKSDGPDMGIPDDLSDLG